MSTQIIHIDPDSFFDSNTTLKIIDISSVHHISTPTYPVITIQDINSTDQIHIYFNVQIHGNVSYVYLQIHQLDEDSNYATHISKLNVILSTTTIQTLQQVHLFIIHNIDLNNINPQDIFTFQEIFKDTNRGTINYSDIHYVLYHPSYSLTTPISIPDTTLKYNGNENNIYIVEKEKSQISGNNPVYIYRAQHINDYLHVLTNLHLFSTDQTTVNIQVDAPMVIVHENMNRNLIDLVFEVEQSTSIIISELYIDFSNIPQDDAYMFFQIQEQDSILFSGESSDKYYNTEGEWKDLLVCIINPSSNPYYVTDNLLDKRPESTNAIISVADLYTNMYMLDISGNNNYKMRCVDLFLPADPNTAKTKDYMYVIVDNDKISMEITDDVLEKNDTNRPTQYFEKRNEFLNDKIFTQVIRRYELLSDRVYIDDINNRDYMDIIIPKDYYFVTIVNQSFLFHKDYYIFEIIKDNDDSKFVFIDEKQRTQDIIRINIGNRDNLFYFYPMQKYPAPSHIHIVLDPTLDSDFELFPGIVDFSNQMIVYKQSDFTINNLKQDNICMIDLSINTSNSAYNISSISDGYKFLTQIQSDKNQVDISLIDIFNNSFIDNFTINFTKTGFSDPSLNLISNYINVASPYGDITIQKP